MFNSLAGVTFHGVEGKQRYLKDNTLQLYLISQPIQA